MNERIPALQVHGRNRYAVGQRVLAALVFSFLATIWAPWRAAAAQQLTPEQEELARRIDAKLIAPCCFRGTVAEHQSPVAEELRGEVRTLLAEGASERQILDHFVAKYGERILATPKAQGFNLLAYVMPVVGLLVGSLLVFVVLRRALPAGLAQPGRGAPDKPSAEEFDESLRIRFEKELERFDR